MKTKKFNVGKKSVSIDSGNRSQGEGEISSSGKHINIS